MSLSNPTNTNRPTPNITPDSATLHLGSSIHINAPSNRVWEVLTNTSTWPNWNSFVPRVTIVSQPDSSPSTTEPLSPMLQKGTRVTFHVRMDPTSTKPQAATDAGLVVTEYEAPNPQTGTAGRIVWASDFDAPGTMGPSLLTAEREHEVKDVEGGTEVRNWELQVGWMVYLVKIMYGGKLRQNFDLWVSDLKAFVEGESEGGQ
ncbi:hypothetical protein PENSTE_c002G09487 [Penicillium steckii]|uniref:Coenzyme Q-binding protein COQ10 START domain-containing protein n=1 Tax=Penicillium steckii TaxID=303698 RepID=A0A1V6TT92_9EURO|nr:hypothetical protein PENSTE_c002G09487 [Penicillium steckii]